MSRITPCRHAILLIILVFAVPVGMSGCAQVGNVLGSVFMMSPEQEREMGAKFAKEVEKQYKVVNDPQLNSYIAGLGQKIWSGSGGGEITPRYHVVQDKEINAFAIPGGDIYVNTGLIKAADDEAELAGVVAHETGHVIRRHSAANVSRQTGAAAIQQIVLGPESGQATQIVSQIFASGALTNFSRQDESEADQIAVKTLYNMKYDPLALRTFFSKLKEKYGDTGGGITKFLSDHPPTQDRIDAVSAMAASFPTQPKNRPVTALRKAQGRLKQLGM